MGTYLSQRLKIGGKEITGPLSVGDKTDLTISDIVNRILEFIYPAAAILLFLYLVWGGFDFLTSTGNPEKIKVGKAKITTSLIGFFLLILSYFIVKLIALIFGINEGIL